MALSELEDQLLEKLSQPRITSESHRAVLGGGQPSRIDEFDCVGFDTNVLKQLRRDWRRAEKILVRLSSAEIRLIVPGQVVIEYWNNHRVFALDDWKALDGAFETLRKKFGTETLDPDFHSRLTELQSSVNQMAGDLQDSKAPDFMAKSANLLEQLLAVGTRPMVSRSRFAALGAARQEAKNPPGFADESRKRAALGDYYVWCDFLLGALYEVHRIAPKAIRQFAWVTEEGKPDWKTGGQGHPALLEEFEHVCGAPLRVMDLQTLESLKSTGDDGPGVPGAVGRPG